MKYYKYPDVYDIYPGPGEKMTYLETEGEVAFRMLTVLEDRYISSNIDFDLPDQPCDYESVEDLIPITPQEFDQVWNAHLEIHRAKWNATKKAFSVGMHVTGSIKLFFPQGTIVNLEHDAIGVADYGQCRASTQPEFMYPRHRIMAVVQGYDEANQWVILRSPQVHADRTD